MPLYEYEYVNDDGSAGAVFEVMQRMSDTPYVLHPENGRACRRIIGTPNTMTHFNGGNLSNDRLGKLGFTKYQKAGGGYYEKKAGSGPDVIKG
jgi:predicted nucleic acid-binding Zn ribbon protein